MELSVNGLWTGEDASGSYKREDRELIVENGDGLEACAGNG